MKKLLLYLAILSMPINVFAYSSHVILGGQTVGIDVETTGVLVVGFYKVNGAHIQSYPSIIEGDYILSINKEIVTDTNSLTDLINKYSSNGSVELLIKRGTNEFTSKLNLVTDGNSTKTGLYVKDSITGIGTLTFIDPENMIYGALGHEIIESNTNQIVDIYSGTIFENSITSINKSTTGTAGSKNAKFYYDNKFGTIIDNTIEGIYGEYNAPINEFDLIEVASSSEVKIGPAVIYTVTKDNIVETYDINITKINETSSIKNLTIEITDKKLLELTGGIVQGMSGSPIIQNDKLVGAVTHVIVDNPETGYGIFIENMLEVSDNISLNQ